MPTSGKVTHKNVVPSSGKVPGQNLVAGYVPGQNDMLFSRQRTAEFVFMCNQQDTDHYFSVINPQVSMSWAAMSNVKCQQPHGKNSMDGLPMSLYLMFQLTLQLLRYIHHQNIINFVYIRCISGHLYILARLWKI